MYVINVLCEIFVDLVVCTPWGGRLAKKQRTDGARSDAHGNLVPVELYGPHCIGDWVVCFNIFRTLCLMYAVITAARLDQ